MMKVRPLHDRVLVKDTAKEKPSQGVVVAVGEGKRDDKGQRIALDVKAGDRVLFGKYAGTEVKVGGDEHLILREDDIQGIIED
jgi:chaperonin GroES